MTTFPREESQVRVLLGVFQRYRKHEVFRLNCHSLIRLAQKKYLQAGIQTAVRDIERC